MRTTKSNTLREIFKPFNLLVFFLWSYNSIIYFVNLFLGRIYSGGEYLTTFILLVLIFLSYKEIKNRIRIVDLLFYFITLTLFLCQYLFYPQNQSILDGYFVSFLFAVVPYFFFGLFIDIKEYKEPFFWISFASVIVQMLYHLWYRPTTGNTSTSEDMIGAYQIAPHIIFLFWTAFDRKRIIYYVISIVSFIFLLSMGNRGSVVCVSLFVLTALLFFIPYKRPIFARTLIIVVGVFLIVYFNSIVNYLLELFVGQGMSVRVLSMIEDNEFATSESRGWIIKTLLDNLDNGPVFGFGIAGDRSVTGVLYAHNFIVEILFSFGYVLGGIILLSLVIYIVLAFRNARTAEERMFLLLLLCSFMKLMMSGTYMEDCVFWILLGYSTLLIRSSHNMKPLLQKT